MIQSRFLMLTIALLGSGCQPREVAKTVRPIAATQSTERPVVIDFQNQIDRHGSITFRSNDGKWIGTDGDTDLIFLAGGSFQMTEYGFAVATCNGSYIIGPTGEITVTLPTFGQKWPVMKLATDSVSLFLTPKDPSTSFVMGNRSSAVGTHSYWPFRPLPYAKMH